MRGEVSLNTFQKKDGSHGASLNVFVNDVELVGGHSQVESESSQESSFLPSNLPVKDNLDALDVDDDVPF
ncbi:MAG: hypothetical protein GQ569_04210 [Methylococcaceae bacterium]|nr:hypothetical protein [Methylococcaceae bacterium]